MRRSIKAAIAAVAMLTAPAMAETFYSKDIVDSPWMVYGVTKDGQNNPACYAEYRWRDGSKMQVIKDLADQELYIWFQNTAWDISDQPGQYKMKLNMYANNGSVSSLDMTYTLINKNTITIRHIISDKFTPPFVTMNRMVMVMPGSIQNAQMTLVGSRNAAMSILECVERSSGVNLYPQGRTNNSAPEIKL